MQTSNGSLEFLINSTNRKTIVRNLFYKNLFQIVLILILFFIIVPDSKAQLKSKADSSQLVKLLRSEEHSATKAALFSALIPGWGQAYNKKYWKIPIVYTGLATVGYFIYDNHNNYIICRDDYIRVYNDPNAQIFNKDSAKTTSALLPRIDEYRRKRDLSVIVLFAVWGLNVVDANVDGHFFSFDVSDDLSLNLQALSGYLPESKSYFGLSLMLDMHY